MKINMIIKIIIGKKWIINIGYKIKKIIIQNYLLNNKFFKFQSINYKFYHIIIYDLYKIIYDKEGLFLIWIFFICLN